MEVSQTLEKYPIYIDSHEQKVIVGIVSDKKHKIPDVWQQLIENKSTIDMSAFELGLLTGLITEKRHKVPIIWKQLIDMVNKFREDAGVKMTDLGNGMVQLKDASGITMVREKYEWEKL